MVERIVPLTSAQATVQEQPVAIEHAGQRLAASYLPAVGPAPPGPRVAALILGRRGPHAAHHQAARALAAAGYSALGVDLPGLAMATEGGMGGSLAAVDEAVAAARAALAALRQRVAPERVVLLAACAAARVAAQCAAAEQADGLVLLGQRLPPEARPADLDVFDHLEPFAGSVLVLGAGDTEEQGIEAQAVAASAARWRGGRPGRHLELAVIDGPRATLPVDGDHTLEPRAYVSVAIDFLLQWLERRYGPGYPRAWQGPPPGPTAAVAGAREGGVAAWVPLLVAGARLV
ncbi:MAG TPA: hypothetical protein VFB73_12710, partial [Chloroflexota bacterium]|nr:hypothetical protein [Chloroflexota bacterium]